MSGRPGAVLRDLLNALQAAFVDLGRPHDRRGFRRFEPGDVEYVVHEFLQVAAVFLDDADIGLPFGGIGIVRGCGQLRKPDDGVERRIDFVCDVGG